MERRIGVAAGTDGGVPACPTIPPFAAKTDFVRGQTRQEMGWKQTFKGRKAAIEEQFEIAKLAFAEGKRREVLGLCGELSLTRGIAGEKVLEDTTMRSVGHIACVFRAAFLGLVFFS